MSTQKINGLISEFRNPVKLIFGKGQIAAIAKDIPTDAKIMITYGGGLIKSNGVYDQVVAVLVIHDYIEFADIGNTPTTPMFPIKKQASVLAYMAVLMLVLL